MAGMQRLQSRGGMPRKRSGNRAPESVSGIARTGWAGTGRRQAGTIGRGDPEPLLAQALASWFSLPFSVAVLYAAPVWPLQLVPGVTDEKPRTRRPAHKHDYAETDMRFRRARKLDVDRR